MWTLAVIALFGTLPMYAAEGWQVQRVISLYYPRLPQLARIAGPVTVRCAVAPEGVAKECTLLSGHPLLGKAASENAKQWTFRRSEANSPEHTTIDIEYVFQFSEQRVEIDQVAPGQFSFEFPNRVMLISPTICPDHIPCTEQEWQTLQKELSKKGKRRKPISFP